jgi:hypothetical protein
VVDVSVVVDPAVVSLPQDSVEVSVVVESESAASGPAPETTPADTRPAANSVTMTNETCSSCPRRRRRAVGPEPISPKPP